MERLNPFHVKNKRKMQKRIRSIMRSFATEKDTEAERGCIK
jgi:hypothetical protein